MRKTAWHSSVFLLLFLVVHNVCASSTENRRNFCEATLKDAFLKTVRTESDLKRHFEAHYACKETSQTKELKTELYTTKSFARFLEISELISQIARKQNSSFETEIQNVCEHLDRSLTRVADILDQMDCQPTFHELREKIGTASKLEKRIRDCEITDWPLPLSLVVHRLVSDEFDKVVNAFNSTPKVCRKPYVSQDKSKEGPPLQAQTGAETTSPAASGSHSGK